MCVSFLNWLWQNILRYADIRCIIIYYNKKKWVNKKKEAHLFAIELSHLGTITVSEFETASVQSMIYVNKYICTYSCRWTVQRRPTDQETKVRLYFQMEVGLLLKLVPLRYETRVSTFAYSYQVTIHVTIRTLNLKLVLRDLANVIRWGRLVVRCGEGRWGGRTGRRRDEHLQNCAVENNK